MPTTPAPRFFALGRWSLRPTPSVVAALFVCILGAPCLHADPLSKKSDIDFFRDVPSRNLKGLATRSDGRLVAGPTLTEIAAPAPADLLWCLEPAGTANKFLVGTGPEGKILEVTFNPADSSYTSTDLAKLDDPQVFTVKALANGSVLAGTSPKGALHLVRNGQSVARAGLPVDSIFDLLLLDADTALVATGNPARIYRVDLILFAASGVAAEKLTTSAQLAERGITLYAEVRDRNVRRLARLADGRVVAGSSPKGNIYTFTSSLAYATAGAPAPTLGTSHQPLILQENRDAEVTDLLPLPNGDLYASLVFSSAGAEARITPPPGKPAGEGRPADGAAPAASASNVIGSAPEKFPGRSALVWFPAEGFPETVASRANTAFYRLARHGELILIAGGELGELHGYDPKSRLALTFAGSISAQLNGLTPLPDAPGKFLLLRNNTPGLALLDFGASGPREAETRRIDLGLPARLGGLRFNRLRGVTESQLSVELRTNYGSDELEGWTPWAALKPDDNSWRAEEPGLRGRNVKLRVRVAADASAALASRPTVEVDKAQLFVLPQNRRPQLQDFRLITPNYGLIPAVEQPPAPNASLNQLMSAGPKDDEAKRKSTFLSSQVVPSPGSQVVFWTVTDPDGDAVYSTFSIRRDGETAWTDLAVNTRDGFTQFDSSHFPDGVYFTRLVATETAPRPPAERLTATFETDDLVIDHTKPEILEATARREADRIIITVRGRDALSLLDGIEVIFNNAVREVVEQPADGIRDSRTETFVLDLPLAKVSNATSAEITLYDSAGNGQARRVTW